MVVGVYNQKREIIKLVVIKKNEIESIEITDRDSIKEIRDFILNSFRGNDEH